jgi:transposase
MKYAPAMLDLKNASRDELIRVVLAQRDALVALERQGARQQEVIARLEAALAEVTRQLGAAVSAGPPSAGATPAGEAGPPKRMPGTKPTQAPSRPAKPRKRRAHGFARRRMAPTARQVHAVGRCPDCGIPLVGGVIRRTREVIEVPVAPAVVTAHVYLERRCPCCRKAWTPPADLSGVVDGRQRFGVGLVGLVATLREELRLPIALIRWYLQTLHGLTMSAGAIVALLKRVAARGRAAVARIRAGIRASPVVNADETGWREAGRNGYVWTLSTPEARYFTRGSRAKATLEAALGADYAGVLVSDFYVAYTTYEGRHQFCWAHLLRDIHELRVAHAAEAGVVGWATAVHALYERATASCPLPADRERQRRAYERELLALCQPYLADAAAPQAGLCRRIEQHLTELFVFVADPAVPADNNGAERSLRHLVTARKISGGTRSPEGSATKMALATLFGTWRVQGLNPLHECCRLVAEPQV